MKKKIYYILPFFIVPCAVLFIHFLDNMNLIKMSPYIFFAITGFISAIMGNLTPTQRKFDLIMTAIMPLSFLYTMFVSGFLDETDLASRFDLGRAFEVAFQPLALLAYLMMAVLAFFASYKAIRMVETIKRNKLK